MHGGAGFIRPMTMTSATVSQPQQAISQETVVQQPVETSGGGTSGGSGGGTSGGSGGGTSGGSSGGTSGGSGGGSSGGSGGGDSSGGGDGGASGGGGTSGGGGGSSGGGGGTSGGGSSGGSGGDGGSSGGDGGTSGGGGSSGGDSGGGDGSGGDGLGGGDDSGGGGGNGPGGGVEIVIQTFIPDPTVSALFIGTFAGDNRRHFDYTPAVADKDYRTRFDINVPPNFFNDPTWSQDAGITKKLNAENQVIQTGQASAADGTLGNTPGTTYDNTTGTLGLMVTGFGRNPLVNLAPAIDYTFNFNIKAGAVTFVGGHHDAFPSYEIFIMDKNRSQLTLDYGYLSAAGDAQAGWLAGTGEEVQVNGPGLNLNQNYDGPTPYWS